MDGQTDRILIARPRLHYMQRGKNIGDVFLRHSVDTLIASHTRVFDWYKNNDLE